MENLLDRFGIGISSACAFHCAIQAFLIPLAMPLGLSEHFFSEGVESLILISAFFIAFIALLQGYKTHGKLLPSMFLLLAFGLTLVSHVFHDYYHQFHTPISFLVGGFFITAHIFNLKYHKVCQAKHCHLN